MDVDPLPAGPRPRLVPGAQDPFRTLDIGEATTPGLTQRASATTINDVLVAALHLTVQFWNTKHGMPTDRIGVQIPVNVRPADRSWMSSVI